MKNLMSVNHKLMVFSPKELIEITNDYKVDGFEVFNNGVDNFDYLSDLAYECKNYNKLFQIHGDSSLDVDKQIEFLKRIETLSDMLGYPINIVFHPFCNDDKEKAVKETNEYLYKITDNCDMNKIIVTLENLNNLYNYDRLNKEDITPIIINNSDVYFTYDIGHEIIDGGNVININKNLLPLIKNVHLHTNNNEYDHGYDHKPIFKRDKNWNSILKGILLLKLNRYDGPVVFEYDVYALPGNDIKEKLIKYAESIDFVSQRF